MPRAPPRWQKRAFTFAFGEPSTSGVTARLGTAPTDVDGVALVMAGRGISREWFGRCHRLHSQYSFGRDTSLQRAVLRREVLGRERPGIRHSGRVFHSLDSKPMQLIFRGRRINLILHSIGRRRGLV